MVFLLNAIRIRMKTIIAPLINVCSTNRKRLIYKENLTVFGILSARLIGQFHVFIGFWGCIRSKNMYQSTETYSCLHGEVITNIKKNSNLLSLEQGRRKDR